MRLRREGLVLAMGVLLVTAVAAVVVFAAVANRKLTEAKARLATLMSSRNTVHPAGQTGNADTSTGSAKSAILNPGERLARFTALVERAKGLRDLHDYEKLFGKPRQNWTDADWDRVKTDVAGIRDLIRQIRELAEAGGFSKDFDRSKGIDADLPHLEQLYRLAGILQLDAFVQGRNGSSEEAVQDIVAILRLANGIAGEPTLSSLSMRFAIDGRACGAARSAVAAGSLSPELTRQLLDAASLSGHRDYFVDWLYCENAYAVDAFARLGQGVPVEQAAPLDWFDDHQSPLRRACTYVGLRTYGSALGAPWRAFDEASYAELVQPILTAAPLPYYQAKPILHEVTRRIYEYPVSDIVARPLLQRMVFGARWEAREEATLDLMRIGLLVDQYHARTGSYPDSLSAIASDLGGTVPVDPLTGQPYVYRLSGSGYFLYSVGSNLVDDGGTDDPSTGDIVWRGPTQQ